MRSMKISCGLAAALLLACATASAHAQASRTWVAKVTGQPADENPCSRTAPCYTFAAAYAKTAPGGEINVLDPGGYGGLTISKSITINGSTGTGYGSMVSAGIVIDMAPDDKFKTVRLNWLDLNGANEFGHGIRIKDNLTPAVSVVIENTNIAAYTGSGILDERSQGGKLVIANTKVRDTWQSGIVIAGGKSSKLQVALSNVGVHNSIQAGLYAYGAGANVMVSNSVFSGNSWGVAVDGAGNAVFVDGSTITGNNQFALSSSSGGTLWLSDSDVSFNGTEASGPVQTFTSNRFTSNGAGDPLTPFGSPTSATGLR